MAEDDEDEWEDEGEYEDEEVEEAEAEAPKYDLDTATAHITHVSASFAAEDAASAAIYRVTGPNRTRFEYNQLYRRLLRDAPGLFPMNTTYSGFYVWLTDQCRIKQPNGPISYQTAMHVAERRIKNYLLSISGRLDPDKLLTFYNLIQHPKWETDFNKNFPMRTEQPAVSYTKWFRNLLGFSHGNFRAKFGRGVFNSSNISQCQGATQRVKKAYVRIKCYLCGEQMINISKMQCEHILPFITAIRFLWLSKGMNDPENNEIRNILLAEYLWAHECCNEAKDAYEFIGIGPDHRFFVIDPNTPPSNSVSSMFHDMVKNFCPADLDNRLKYTEYIKHYNSNIRPMIESIVDALNSEIDHGGRNDERAIFFHVFSIMKVFSCFTDGNFTDMYQEVGTMSAEKLALREARRIQLLKKKRERIERILNAERKKRDNREESLARFPYSKRENRGRKKEEELQPDITAKVNKKDLLSKSNKLKVGNLSIEPKSKYFKTAAPRKTGGGGIWKSLLNKFNPTTVNASQKKFLHDYKLSLSTVQFEFGLNKEYDNTNDLLITLLNNEIARFIEDNNLNSLKCILYTKYLIDCDYSYRTKELANFGVKKHTAYIEIFEKFEKDVHRYVDKNITLRSIIENFMRNKSISNYGKKGYLRFLLLAGELTENIFNMFFPDTTQNNDVRYYLKNYNLKKGSVKISMRNIDDVRDKLIKLLTTVEPDELNTTHHDIKQLLYESSSRHSSGRTHKKISIRSHTHIESPTPTSSSHLRTSPNYTPLFRYRVNTRATPLAIRYTPTARSTRYTNDTPTTTYTPRVTTRKSPTPKPTRPNRATQNRNKLLSPHSVRQIVNQRRYQESGIKIGGRHTRKR